LWAFFVSFFRRMTPKSKADKKKLDFVVYLSYIVLIESYVYSQK